MRRGFTLIELLIVVAIIAILAAIAVPNFLEAQVRSKVSRAKADMRSVATAMESYAVDNNTYPVLRSTPTHGNADYNGYLWADGQTNLWPALTTPISYISSYPIMPFDIGNFNDDGDRYSTLSNFSFLYVNFRGAAKDLEMQSDLGGVISSPTKVILVGNEDTGTGVWCDWLIFSVGPSRILDDSTSLAPTWVFGEYVRYERWSQGAYRPYDATNGTTSWGYIFRLGGGGSTD